VSAPVLLASAGLLVGAFALPAFAEGPVPDLPTTPDQYIAEGLLVPAFRGSALADRFKRLDALNVQCDGRPLPCYVTGAIDAPRGLIEFSGVISADGPNAMADITLLLADGQELDIRVLVPREQLIELMRDRRFRP